MDNLFFSIVFVGLNEWINYYKVEELLWQKYLRRFYIENFARNTLFNSLTSVQAEIQKPESKEYSSPFDLQSTMWKREVYKSAIFTAV